MGQMQEAVETTLRELAVAETGPYAAYIVLARLIATEIDHGEVTASSGSQRLVIVMGKLGLNVREKAEEDDELSQYDVE